MTIVTLALFVIGTLIMVRSRAIIGLLVYCAGLVWYPQYLSISIASIDFTLSRALVIVLFLIVVVRDKMHKHFQWQLVDILLIIYFFVRLIAISQNEKFSIFIVREGAFFLNAFLLYWLVRNIIRDKSDLVTFFKGLVILSVPIALFGIYETITGHNVYAFTKAYHAWMSMEHRLLIRHGFYRADVSFGQYIAYGMYFAALVPISMAIFDKRNVVLYTSLVMIMIGGTLSSMSSGPYFSLAISLMTILLFPFKGYWKVISVSVIISICFLEFYSNRSWYEALTRFAFSSNTAYYRVALIDEALHGGMDGNWLTGYGYVGLDAAYNSLGKFWNWEHRDLTNIYIQILVRYGLINLLVFLMINFNYYKQLFVGFRKLKKQDSWMIWCLFATMFGWNVAMQTVGLIAQLTSMFFIYMAICVNSSFLFQQKEKW